jgi:hypothetical protein
MRFDLAVLRDVVVEERLLEDMQLRAFKDESAKEMASLETEILKAGRVLYAQSFHKQLDAAFEVGR